MTCGVVVGVDVPGVSVGGGRGPGGTMEVLTLTIACRERRPPADAIFAHPSGCPQPVPDGCLLDEGADISRRVGADRPFRQGDPDPPGLARIDSQNTPAAHRTIMDCRTWRHHLP